MPALRHLAIRQLLYFLSIRRRVAVRWPPPGPCRHSIWERAPASGSSSPLPEQDPESRYSKSNLQTRCGVERDAGNVALLSRTSSGTKHLPHVIHARIIQSPITKKRGDSEPVDDLSGSILLAGARRRLDHYLTHSAASSKKGRRIRSPTRKASARTSCGNKVTLQWRIAWDFRRCWLACRYSHCCIYSG